jgi:hypothetical protein
MTAIQETTTLLYMNASTIYSLCYINTHHAVHMLAAMAGTTKKR